MHKYSVDSNSLACNKYSPVQFIVYNKKFYYEVLFGKNIKIFTHFIKDIKHTQNPSKVYFVQTQNPAKVYFVHTHRIQPKFNNANVILITLFFIFPVCQGYISINSSHHH